MSNNKKDLLKRMSYLKGHLGGVYRMIDEDKYCIDIIKQNQAVIAAISKINELLLSNHLNSCVKTAVEKGSVEDKQKAFDEILEVFKEQG
jgi:CsoR family transcriptional regulator, copper-sensing transcriptional repressor